MEIPLQSPPWLGLKYITYEKFSNFYTKFSEKQGLIIFLILFFTNSKNVIDGLIYLINKLMMTHLSFIGVVDILTIDDRSDVESWADVIAS